VDAVIEDWRPSQLVVGVPDESSAGDIAARATAFAAALARRYGLPVAAVDESLTSRAASSELAAARRTGGSTKKVGRDRIDRHAACLIAEQWMREQPNDRRANQ
jgi:putative Holliday junction resolvase